MSTSPPTIALADADDRQTAISTFDRNLVVTAGAGTGKTTLLVDRLVHLLLRNPDPLRITEIVALTFTNKAANEMKLRLRERLQSYLGTELDREPAEDAEEKAKREVESLIARYQLSKDELDRRVHDALRNLERSDIGTIHSFAATLLRLYPLDAGVDPQFHEDDGREFDRLFDEQWDLWLDQELALGSSQADAWRNVLGKLTLEKIKELAKSLSSEAVELGREELNPNSLSEPLRAWLQGLESRTATLIGRHPEERMNEKLVRAAASLVKEFLKTGKLEKNQLTEERVQLAGKSINRTLKGWSEPDLSEAQELVRAAKGLAQVDAALTHLLWRLLVPFAEKFRDHFVRQGFVSFDGLLIRARDLVRDRLQVRQELKRQYRTILIDEFQDTDPVQYEILLYLAELAGNSSKDWRQIKITPGKIFVVGDPKQSIYAFRRADIEAYLEVVEKIIKAQNGIECRLTTNFRSDGAILDVVNGTFESLIQAQDGVQPPYIAIHPAPQRGGIADSNLPKVMLRKIVAADDEVSAEKARRLEGESLARWLKEEILSKTEFLNSQGERVRAQPKDIAILFRKLTDIHDYLEPFRRHDIRYVVEGERHFYAAKEIIDAVNLLRAIENPHDRLALVGVLRSPLGGLTDRQIYHLHRERLLDYREANQLKQLDDKSFPSTLNDLYSKLAALHQEIGLMPVGAAVTHVFATLPVKLLAAWSFNGEQAVANLEKLRQQAELLGREGLTTLKAAIHQLQQRVLETKEEGESVLAEENLDAVRIMSIHKAKGLEFPIVVLAGCQTGTDGRRGGDAEALFDWSSGLTGLRVGQSCDLAGLYIAEKSRRRAEEEQKRVLYVAMTRAREHLIISCAPSGRRSGGSFVSMIDSALNSDVDTAETSQSIRAGAGKVELRILTQTLTAPGKSKSKSKPSKKKPDWQPFADTWARRRTAFDKAIRTAPFITPTLLKRQEEITSEAGAPSIRTPYPRTTALLVGELAHRFLQNCQFTTDAKIFDAQLQDFIERVIPADSQPDRAAIVVQLREIFHRFQGSKAYVELAGAHILGREVPLLLPWNGQIMEGVIDLMYEKNGLLYLADYKTDRIQKDEFAQAIERYRQQAEIYSQAARRSLRRDVASFKLIFLRLGEAVDIGLTRGQGELFRQTSI